jgi:hypothetical protein
LDKNTFSLAPDLKETPFCPMGYEDEAGRLQQPLDFGGLI